jgi:alcohol dehydrogenase class IV
MDSYLTACTGMDALTHAIEAYVSIVSSPMTDLHAMKAIEIVSHFLPDTIKNPDNLPLREKIMFASTEAGLAFSNAILGAVHALSHSLGGYMDLPHGECNSLLLEHVVDYNFHYAEEKYKKVAQIMGLHIKGMTSKEIRKELFRSIQRLKKEVGITKTLTNIGVKSADIPVLAGKAFHDACLLTNPRKASKEDIKIIYEEAI